MRLTAYLNGTRVGWFEQGTDGIFWLGYDPTWQRQSGRLELSVSLPKSRRIHKGAAVENFLWNLLPDNAGVLNTLGKSIGASPRNPMALLREVGLDVAGAVQLIDSDQHDEPVLNTPGSVTPLDDALIAAKLRDLRLNPNGWGEQAGGGYFSLSGAQPKFTLLHTPDGWAEPVAGTASTHIVKPGIDGRDFSDVSEHLTMRAAAILGLVVAESRVELFEDQTAIVIKRFDRQVLPDGSIMRLHQEDFAQVFGIHPEKKYQSDGGPGFAGLTETIETHSSPRDAHSTARLFDAALFNWVSLSTDAHAKNYALLYGPDRTSYPLLAPLYDLGTTLMFDDIHARKVKYAMSFGGKYADYQIERRHILAEATALAVPHEYAMERARHIASGLGEAFSQAVRESHLSGDVAVQAAALVNKANERLQHVLKLLSQ